MWQCVVHLRPGVHVRRGDLVGAVRGSLTSSAKTTATAHEGSALAEAAPIVVQLLPITWWRQVRPLAAAEAQETREDSTRRIYGP